jgi:DNA-binding SARP family transcriptional activator
MDLNESTAETMDPRSLVNLLARLGNLAEEEPALLLLRATAERDLGQVDRAASDIDKAVLRSVGARPALRHRVEVEAARARLTAGDVAAAVRIAEQALGDLGPGEERTYARAYDLLGQCAATADGRADLQRATECYQVAAAAWDSCGEHGRARTTRCDLAMSALIPLGRTDEALAVLAQQLASPQMSDAERSWVMVMEGFALVNANRLESAHARFDRVTDLGYVQENPRLVAAAAWGHAMVAWRQHDRPGVIRHLAAAENTALGVDDDVLGIPFLCDAATALGAVGELELAEAYLARAVERRPLFRDQIASTRFLLDARRGRLGDVAAALRATPPAEWWRIHFVAAVAHAHAGELPAAAAEVETAERLLTALGIGDPASLGEAAAAETLAALAHPEPRAAPAPRPTVTAATAAPPRPYLVVMNGPISVREPDGGETPIPAGNPQRLIGVVAAYGGSASLDQISEAVWPGDPVNASRARLRNVLMRLRRGGGELLVRSGAGVRFAPGVRCDLQEFERRAGDALASTRADPELAGRLAVEAIELAVGTAFADFEYEEWAMNARRSVEQQLINLLDLLSVQAEDAGDLPAAQAYAERALRLDRYSDSRYVRLSELLAMQDRVAAAIAVLDDAAAVARELGGALPSNVRDRRGELVRKTALRSSAR